MKTAVVVAAFLAVVLSALIRTGDTQEYIEVCPLILAPVCDTEGGVHGNNCTLRVSGAQYDGSRCYNWQEKVCEPIPETGCVGPDMGR